MLTSTFVETADRREDLADGWVHALGVGAGLVGFIVMMQMATLQGSPVQIASLVVYGCALLAMLVCSAVYNHARNTVHGRRLQRVDHAAIFVMIAATYTPFLAVKIGGAWGLGLLAGVWTVALAGVAMKLFLPLENNRLSITLYLALGWTVLLTLGPLTESLSVGGLVLLFGGGILYTVGVLFHLWERLPYNRAIWHGFVLAAAACHYAAIVGDVALPGLGA